MPGFTTPGFRSLDNFFLSLQFTNPAMADLMHSDLMGVALNAISGTQEEAYEAVFNLRSRALALPAVHARVLDSALEALGYELDILYDV